MQISHWCIKCSPLLFCQFVNATLSITTHDETVGAKLCAHSHLNGLTWGKSSSPRCKSTVNKQASHLYSPFFALLLRMQECTGWRLHAKANVCTVNAWYVRSHAKPVISDNNTHLLAGGEYPGNGKSPAFTFQIHCDVTKGSCSISLTDYWQHHLLVPPSVCSRDRLVQHSISLSSKLKLQKFCRRLKNRSLECSRVSVFVYEARKAAKTKIWKGTRKKVLALWCGKKIQTGDVTRPFPAECLGEKVNAIKIVSRASEQKKK